MKTYNTKNSVLRLQHIQSLLTRRPMTAGELVAEIGVTLASVSKWMAHLESLNQAHVADYIERKNSSGATIKTKLYAWGPGKQAPKPSPEWPSYKVRTLNDERKPYHPPTNHAVARDPLVAAFFGV